MFKGQLLAGDFSKNTMTFEIEGEMVLTAGHYVILTKEEHEKLHAVKTRLCINCIKCGQDSRTSTIHLCYNEISNVKTIADAYNQVCNCHRYVGEKQ